MRQCVAMRRYNFRAAAALYLRYTGHWPPRRVLRTLWQLSVDP